MSVEGGVERSREPDLLAQTGSHGMVARMAQKRRPGVEDLVVGVAAAVGRGEGCG
jgi:hypothetical protein